MKMGRHRRTAGRGLAAMLVATVAALGVIASTASAEPGFKLPVTDLANTKWTGGSGFGQESMTNAGDVNGDGLDDVAVSNNEVTAAGVFVLFTPKKGVNSLGDVNERVASLATPPSQGYLLKGPGLNLRFVNAGDQNGDGIPDLVLANQSQSRVYVVYGVSDPSSLPQCAAPDPLRCLDMNAMDPEDGYVLQGPVGSAFGSGVSRLDDVNGDDVDDIMIGGEGLNLGSGATGGVYLIFGGLEPADAAPIDVTTLGASQAVSFEGPEVGASFGNTVSNAGDLDKDGLGDVIIGMGGYNTMPANLYVVYGKALVDGSFNPSDFGAAQGFSIAPTLLSVWSGANIGDVNGDGTDDLMVGGTSFVAGQGGAATVVYTPTAPTSQPISGVNPGADQGYAYTPNETAAQVGGQFGINGYGNLGDMNGDGVPDQLVAAPQTPLTGANNAGAAYVLFGKRPGPAAALGLGPELVPDVGLAITGTAVNQRQGRMIAPAGDVDNDGIPDLFTSGNGTGAGLNLVLGRSFLTSATTGLAGSVTAGNALLSGNAVANGRESSVQFQYGTDTSYGTTTSAENIGSGNGSRSVEAGVAGLQANTTYHYRVVVENDLGIKSYGADRSFTTSPTPQTPCEVDPTAPGCGDYCKANPSAPACAEPKAGLSSLIASAQASKVKRGKVTIVRTWITNTGTKEAEGVRVCLRAPKNLIRGAKCVRVGKLGQGATAMRKFKVRVNKKARKGRKATLAFTATGNGLGNRSAKVRIAIR